MNLDPEHNEPPAEPPMEPTGRLAGQNRFTDAQQLIQSIRTEVQKVIVGQDQLIDNLLISLLSQQHVLIQGMPGLAKTLCVKALSRALDLDFSRIQFTPDLMPSDVVGTNIFNFKTQTFEFHRGPIFSNFILADEINRAPAKSQSALFEVMEERQVTVDGTRYPMDEPFIIIATQNPIDLEGTYRLPEAQLDRFAVRIDVDYPDADEEKAILMRYDKGKHADLLGQIQNVCGAEQLRGLKDLLEHIVVDDAIYSYITSLVRATRHSQDIMIGASPRAAISILRSAKTMALMHGRDFVTPDDVVEVAPPALVHRVMLSPNRSIEGATGAEVIAEIVHHVEVPR